MQLSSSSTNTIRGYIQAAEVTLAAGPHPDRARRDAESLLLHLFVARSLEVNRAWLLAHGDDSLSERDAVSYSALIQRRLAGEPVQYITGSTEFFGMPFRVTREVLIPRPETEHLVETTLALVENHPQPRVVDVGTGSGIIAISLARHLVGTTVNATDISSGALEVARENALRNGLHERIIFSQGDLLSAVAGQTFDVVVSNPPYVSETDRTALDAEVRDFEPATALFAGDDGLSVYRRLIPAALSSLVSGGRLVLEIGHGQKLQIYEMFSALGYDEIAFVDDLRGIPRVATARKP